MRAVRKNILIVAIVMIAYMSTALATSLWLLGVRPVFDDAPTVPPPYDWSCPPSDLKASNVPPVSAEEMLKLDRNGSEPGTVATQDNQAVVTFFRGSFPTKPHQRSIRIDIKPSCPSIIGAPPQSLYYDGNAYTISALYEPSGQPASLAAKSCPLGQTPKTCPTIVMTYVYASAKAMFLRSATTWISVPNATTVPTSLQMFADTPSLGTFAITDASPPTKLRSRNNITSITSIVAALLAVAAGLIGSRIRSKKRTINKKRKAK
ncbi:MAG: hypothetical protein ACYDCC_06735 [Actinomycetota bacterium]